MVTFQILKQLSFKVKSLVKDNKIGEPNFVRCIVIIDLQNKSQINVIKTALLSMIQLWFGTTTKEVELHEIIGNCHHIRNLLMLPQQFLFQYLHALILLHLNL